MLLTLAQPAAARDLWTGDDLESSLSLQSALKSSLLLSRAPDDPLLFPERTSGASLWRERFTLTADASDWLTAQAAYELREQISSSAAGGFGAAAVLPQGGALPYRLAQLDWGIASEPSLAVRHEIDRASVAWHPAFGELTIGRQAIGYGRGVLFSAVDVFAPFSPLEVDREWRRGVDAVHAEARFSEHLSADVAGGFGKTLGDSAFIGRVRGFAGNVDGALLAGRRSTDWMFGATSSATLGDTALYGEAAWFYTRGDGLDGGWLGSSRWVAKLVGGGSYRVDVGQGLRLNAEYHYSGFGVRHAGGVTTQLADPAFARRFARGDSQLLGRHAFALIASYDPFSDLTATLTSLVTPVDGSGLVSPSLRWTASDRVALLLNAFFPWGPAPRGASLRSEWGVVPISAFLQLAFYD